MVGKVVEPASEIYTVANEIEKEHDLIRWPADDESAADHQWRDDSVTSGVVWQRRTGGIHLKEQTKGTLAVWRSENGVTHIIRKYNKNSSGDEIANVNFLTTILHTRRPTSKYRKRDKPTSFNKLDDS